MTEKKFVTKKELMAEVWLSYAPLTKYMKRIGKEKVLREEKKTVIAQLLAQKAENGRCCRKKSGETRREKARKTCCPVPKPKTEKTVMKSGQRKKPAPVSAPSEDFGWHVSIWGKKGWLVVRAGTKDEIDAWAAMLVDNGIMAEARRNEYTGEVEQ